MSAGQIAAALGAIAGLVFLVGDRLPWGGEDGSGARPPRVLEASVGRILTEHKVRYGSFLRTIDGLAAFKAGAGKRGIPPPVVRAQLATRGVEMAFDLAIDGPPGRRLELTPKVYKANGRIAAEMPPVAPIQTEHYSSEAWNDQRSSSTWAPYPATPGDYYIELRFDELKGESRDFVVRKRTDIFRVAAR